MWVDDQHGSGIRVCRLNDVAPILYHDAHFVKNLPATAALRDKRVCIGKDNQCPQFGLLQHSSDLTEDVRGVIALRLP